MLQETDLVRASFPLADPGSDVLGLQVANSHVPV